MIRPSRSNRSAFTLVELMMSTGICTLIMGGLFACAFTMQKCFVATEDYAVGKCDQMRMTDYLSLDLRRALTVTKGTDGVKILTVQIPDYYRYLNGKLLPPAIAGLTVNYGDPALPVTVIYTKNGSSIYRQENANPPVEIATNVDDFAINVTDDLGKVVKTQITFSPRFRKTATADTQTATSVYNTTLLRNKRRPSA